jgi:hypothetical protein
MNDKFNIYYYVSGICYLQTGCIAAALNVPPVGMFVEIGGNRFVVTKVTYIPQENRYSVEMKVA